jgi:2,5-diketo-D-gluconate reductase A
MRRFPGPTKSFEERAMTNQPIVTLNDGVEMPQFGLGVFQTPPETTAKVVRQAIAAGYRMVDTAAMYRNEEGVGEAVRDRPDVFVTTKLDNSDHGFDAALRAFDASAKRLRREPVDLYLIHWPRPRVGLYVETWKALIRLKREGRIRSIGVSNFTRDHLERIVGETGVWRRRSTRSSSTSASSRRPCAPITTSVESEPSPGARWEALSSQGW